MGENELKIRWTGVRTGSMSGCSYSSEMTAMKLLTCRTLASLRQTHLQQRTIFYSTSVPGEIPGKPVGQFSLLCVQNGLGFCSVLAAGLVLRQREPRLLKSEL